MQHKPFLIAFEALPWAFETRWGGGVEHCTLGIFYGGRQICFDVQPGSQACCPPTRSLPRVIRMAEITRRQMGRTGLIPGQCWPLLGLEDLGKAQYPCGAPASPPLSESWIQRELPSLSAEECQGAPGKHHPRLCIPDRLRSGTSPGSCCQRTSQPAGRSWWATPAEWAWWSGTPQPPTSSSALATTTR